MNLYVTVSGVYEYKNLIIFFNGLKGVLKNLILLGLFFTKITNENTSEYSAFKNVNNTELIAFIIYNFLFSSSIKKKIESFQLYNYIQVCYIRTNIPN